jgi:hypothetical protein
MILRLMQTAARRLVLAVIFLFAADALIAAPIGPTLQLDYGHGKAHDNPISDFMYFVPLISPETVTVYTNVGNTQGARVLSLDCQTNGQAFSATCKFAFTGAGSQQNVFDHAHKISSNEKELHAGGTCKHQLCAINVAATGNGTIEIEGAFTNGQLAVNVVRLRFDSREHPSPVTIDLQDMIYRNGAIQFENEMVARVNSLTFRRSAGTPKMEISLASLKSKAAGDGGWQNFFGNLKGLTANLFLPPLKVEPEGQQAMLDFGRALVLEKPNFSFPHADRLKGSAPSK